MPLFLINLCVLPLFPSKFLYLLCNQFRVVKVVYLHSLAYIVQGCGSGFPGSFATFLQHVVDGGDVFFKLLAAVADRLQCLLHNFVEELLTFMSPRPPRW